MRRVQTKSLYCIAMAGFMAMFLMLHGCGTFNVGVKPISEMSPKEKAAFMMSIYNRQAENYKAMASRPDLTEEYKEVLRDKKKILSAVYPLIESYVAYVDNGAVPSPDLEQRIFDYIDQLTLMVIQ